MSSHRMISTRFWADTFVMDKLSRDERLFFLYLLTNEYTNIAGIYEIPLRKMSLDSGFTRDEVTAMLENLKPKVYYIGGWIYIKKFVEHQQNNPNINLGVIRIVSSLPTAVRKEIERLGIESERLLKAWQGFKRLDHNFEPLTLNLKVKTVKSKLPNGNAEVLKNIQRVFNHYVKQFGQNPNQYKLTDKRKAKIKVRLKDAGVDMMLKAIDNTAESKFHMGDNDRGWKADLDWIINSYERLEKQANLDKLNKDVEFSVYDKGGQQ